MKDITNAIFPMKSIYIILLGLILPLSIFSQTSVSKLPQIDTRLYDVYEKEYLESVQKEEPYFIHRWNFYLDNAFFISDSPLAKDDRRKEDYPSVSIPDLTRINIMKLEQEQTLKRDFYVETIYSIKGTDKYLVYYPGRDFVERLNEYLNKVKGDK